MGFPTEICLRALVLMKRKISMSKSRHLKKKELWGCCLED